MMDGKKIISWKKKQEINRKIENNYLKKSNKNVADFKWLNFK